MADEKTNNTSSNAVSSVSVCVSSPSSPIVLTTTSSASSFAAITTCITTTMTMTTTSIAATTTTTTMTATTTTAATSTTSGSANSPIDFDDMYITEARARYAASAVVDPNTFYRSVSSSPAVRSVGAPRMAGNMHGRHPNGQYIEPRISYQPSPSVRTRFPSRSPLGQIQEQAGNRGISTVVRPTGREVSPQILLDDIRPLLQQRDRMIPSFNGLSRNMMRHIIIPRGVRTNLPTTRPHSFAVPHRPIGAPIATPSVANVNSMMQQYPGIGEPGTPGPIRASGQISQRYDPYQSPIPIGDPHVTVGDPSVAVRDPRVTVGDPRVTVRDPRVTVGDPRVTVESSNQSNEGQELGQSSFQQLSLIPNQYGSTAEAMSPMASPQSPDEEMNISESEQDEE